MRLAKWENMPAISDPKLVVHVLRELLRHHQAQQVVKLAKEGNSVYLMPMCVLFARLDTLVSLEHRNAPLVNLVTTKATKGWINAHRVLQATSPPLLGLRHARLARRVSMRLQVA